MRIVMAALIKTDGRYLICRRPEGKRLAGYWEFPGGKLEQGETPEQGLARELMEELGFEAEIGTIFDARLEGGEFLVLYYFASVASGEPTALEHSEIRTVAPEELMEYQYSAADTHVARRLCNGGAN